MWRPLILRLLIRICFYRGSSTPNSALLQGSRTFKSVIPRTNSSSNTIGNWLEDLSMVEDKAIKNDTMKMLLNHKNLRSKRLATNATHHTINLKKMKHDWPTSSSIAADGDCKRCLMRDRQADEGWCFQTSLIIVDHSYRTGTRKEWYTLKFCELSAPQHCHYIKQQIA